MWRLQGGSYIPGFSGQAYGAGLQRDVTKTRKDQAKKAAALRKYMNKRGALGKWAGNIVGAGVGVGLGAMGMGPLGLTIGKTLGAGLGSRLGSSKMISGEGPSMAPGAGTGLLGSTYEQLGEAKGGIDEAMRGQAYGAGAAQLMSGLTGVAGDKLGAQVGDMFGKWKAGRTGLSGYEPTGIGNAFGLDMAGTRTPFGGAGNTLLPGYGGLGLGPNSAPTSSPLGLNQTFSLQEGGPALPAWLGLSLDNKYSLDKPLRSSKWYSPEDGSEEYGVKASPKMAEMQEKLRGMAGEGLLFDPETGDPIEREESMLERIKGAAGSMRGAAGSMFNPFHGVEKESPMQQYAQQLSPEIMSLLEEYGGKDVPEREPFDLMGNLGGLRKGAMGKLGGLGRGAGNLLSSVINPFHGMETESPRSSWTGLPMQIGGMMPGGGSVDMERAVAHARKSLSPEEIESVNLGHSSIVPSIPRSRHKRIMERNRMLKDEYGDWDNVSKQFTSQQLGDMIPEFQMGGMMPGGVSNALPYQEGGFQEKLENLTSDWKEKLGSNLYTEEGDYTREGLLKMIGEPQSSQIDTIWGGQYPNQAIEMMINGRPINLSSGSRWEADKLHEENRLKEQWRKKDPKGFKNWTQKRWGSGSGDLFDEMGGSDEDFFGDDFQTGGMIQRYNLGGSVTQQPMAYQLGGLLKYKRSPMMG